MHGIVLQKSIYSEIKSIDVSKSYSYFYLKCRVFANSHLCETSSTEMLVWVNIIKLYEISKKLFESTKFDLKWICPNHIWAQILRRIFNGFHIYLSREW